MLVREPWAIFKTFFHCRHFDARGLFRNLSSGCPPPSPSLLPFPLPTVHAVDFYLDGRDGLLEYISMRLHQNGHCVVVVAEGAGQDLVRNFKGTRRGARPRGPLALGGRRCLL